MTSKPGLLKNIREQIAARQSGQPAAPKCPLCGGALTVERTKYFISEVCESCLDHVSITDHTDCCDNPSLHRVRFITAGNTVQVRDQCLTCGSVKGNSLGGYTKETREKLPLLDELARKQRGTDYSELYMAFYKVLNEKREKLRLSRRDQIKENWFKEYNKYLNSPEWRTKREKVLKRDNYQCQCCLNSYATQVHHKSYEFEDLTGAVPAFDLISVCGPCHDRIEKMKQEKRESNNL
jgi:5-methylcytosine-specific restriction endonuclease McrA